jgi:inner membrane protein
MLTAHLPSGYILARMSRHRARYLMPAALIGAVLPDLDMLWFHLVDQGAVHHHRYWPHIPLIWLGIAVVSLPILRYFGLLAPGLVFFAAILLHMVLDTIAGGILWGYPINDTLFSLTVVPATYSHWITSFILHWTFLPEIAVWVWAIWLWTYRRQA